MRQFGFRTTKVRAKLGDIIKFDYSPGSDKNPVIVYLNTMKAENETKFVTGFNLNYVQSKNLQFKIVDFINYNSEFNSPKKLYDSLVFEFPFLKKAYRFYNISGILNPKKYDFNLKKLINAS